MAKVTINITIDHDLLTRVDEAGRDRFGGMWNRSAWFADLARRELGWQASMDRAIEMERQGLVGGASTRKGEGLGDSMSDPGSRGSRETAEDPGVVPPPASKRLARKTANPIPKGSKP